MTLYYYFNEVIIRDHNCCIIRRGRTKVKLIFLRNTVVQSQKPLTVYFSSKQLQPFGFTEQHRLPEYKRGLFPGLGGLKETKIFLSHPLVKLSIVGSLRDREVACSVSDLQGHMSGGQRHLTHFTIR